MTAVEINHLYKSYNGKPDSGEVGIFGEMMNETLKNKIGYLPEERGLYKRLTAIDQILYFSSLKGMDRSAAEEKAHHLLHQTGMPGSLVRRFTRNQRQFQRAFRSHRCGR